MKGRKAISVRVRQVTFCLFSNDVKATFDYYTTGLLFRKVWYSPEYCTVALSNIHLSFMRNDHELRPVPTGGVLAFDIAEIHRYYQSIRRVGRVQLRQELNLLPSGAWQFTVLDNNLYQLSFFESPRNLKYWKPPQTQSTRENPIASWVDAGS